MRDKKTLHLNLKRKWFDMILSGEKKEEYREIKRHWINILFWNEIDNGETYDEIGDEAQRGDYDLIELARFYDLSTKEYETITFSNGFKKNRPQFIITLKGLKLSKGKMKWGALNKKYFVLELGEILNKDNCEV